MKIILITGYAGSGKDTLGKLFIEKGYKRYAFADIVKIRTAETHGFPFELTQTQEGKSTLVTSKLTNKQATVREFLIIDSAEAKAKFNDNAFWAKILENIIQIDKPTKVVITDWRYKAEYEHFSNVFDSYFGSNIQSIKEPRIINTIRVVRDNITISDDPSEHELDSVKTDYTFQNNGSLEELKLQLNRLFLFE